MSWDLGWDVPDLEELDARKLWADFPFPAKVTKRAKKVAFESLSPGPQKSPLSYSFVSSKFSGFGGL